jgi:hypothetical protein
MSIVDTEADSRLATGGFTSLGESMVQLRAGRVAAQPVIERTGLGIYPARQEARFFKTRRRRERQEIPKRNFD